MVKWILLGIIFYILYKSAGPIFSIIKFSQRVKEKQVKTQVRSKVNKMDIQDAEFEESPE
jgi:hypothetical protein|tara:strand:- start:5044 stop:5223 length:180 start_codon:yes stop_codon:yes gene_type:complete